MYYLNINPELISSRLEEEGYIVSQNPEVYLPLVNKITDDRATLIGNTVLNSISNVAKYVIQKKSSTSSGVKRSWVDKVSESEDMQEKKVKS